MPSRNFLSLFGLDSDQDVRKTAIAAAREAYAVLPVQVGGKAPLCTLTTREFREVGPRHDCGVHHAITDPDHAGRVFTRLTKGSARINLGMVAGPSRLLVVDADTDEEVRAFLRDWADAEDDLGYLTHTPTVRTPGLLDDRGEWCHKNGGHFHFSLPDDVTLPWDVRGSVKAEGGYDVRWGMSQTLVPPSVRPEGPYRATGDILEAPTWLLDRARDAIDQAALRRLERAALTAHDGVARWSMSVSWSELLTRHGWHPTGKVERCGCAIWTKPGGGSTSYKSATAHEPDCLRYDSIEGHGPLHLWTTEPPAELMSYVLAGQQTITKLMFVAAMEYGGSIAEAMRGLGIDDLGPQVAEWLNDPSTSPDTCGPDASPDVFPGTRGASPAVGPRPQGMGGDAGDSSSNDGLVPESPSLGGGDPGTHDGEEQEEHRFWEPHELADEPFRTAVVESAKRVKVAQRGRDFLAWREAEFGGTETISTVLSIDLSQPAQPVTPDVAVRQDGVPLLYRSRVNTIFGPSESGKSWFSLACAVSVVRAGGSVLVVDMEDDLGGFLHRLRTVGVNQVEAQSFAYQRPWTLGDRERSVILAAARGRDLLVVDSMDAMTALLGVGEGALAIRSVGSILKQWAVMSGAAVLLVDHSTEKLAPGERSETQLGSSAKKQLIDGATYRADRIGIWAPDKDCQTMITVGKDRHGWAKANAVFETEHAAWGRMALMRMQPNWPTDVTSSLTLLRPPSFAEHAGTTADQQCRIEDEIVEWLSATPQIGQWQNKTDVFKAGGDKNGRSGQQTAIDALLEAAVIETREMPMRGGRLGRQYRYDPPDAS